MFKNLFAILLCTATTFSSSIDESAITPHKVFQHSWQIQIADMQLNPISVSAKPHFYCITVPATKYMKQHHFYVLLSRHDLPIQVVMPNRTLKKLMDECAFVVSETTDERGENLSESVLAKHRLLLDDVAHKELVDAEEKSIEAAVPSESVRQMIIGKQTNWLNNWYNEIPEFFRAQLENDKDLLLPPGMLQKMHPILIIDRIFERILPDAVADKKARELGMDSAIKNLCKNSGKPYLGLETLRDRLDAGLLDELKEQIQDFMRDGNSIYDLQSLIKQIPEREPQIGQQQMSLWTDGACHYFEGKFPVKKPSKSCMQRTQNWKPDIMELALTNDQPWILDVGLDHAPILQWFLETNCDIRRLVH